VDEEKKEATERVSVRIEPPLEPEAAAFGAGVIYGRSQARRDFLFLLYGMLWAAFILGAAGMLRMDRG
jgi:hypothetical protein